LNISTPTRKSTRFRVGQRRKKNGDARNPGEHRCDLFRVPDVLGAIRHVWSAAVLQAKSEDDRIGLRECIRPLLE
jgi:hypothetical protein